MTVTFSEVTNRAGFSDELTRFDVDSLFTFGIYSLGQGYIGEWTDDQTLVITITDPLGATPVEIGFVVAQVRFRACSIALTSLVFHCALWHVYFSIARAKGLS